MSDDFGFEFVDEETEETPQPRRPRAGLSGDAGSGSGGRLGEKVAGRRRLAIAAVAGLIVLILVVVVVTGGSGGKGEAYKAYFGRLAPIAAGSQQVGTSLVRLLTQLQHGRISDPGSTLDTLVGRAQAQLAAGQRLKPPAGLRPVHGQVLSALAFRVSGLQGLRAALGRLRGSAGNTGLPTALAKQIDVLVTGDVVWRVLFLQPAIAALRQLHLAASLAPRSIFVANTDLSSPQSIAALVQPQAPAAAPVLRLGSTGAAVVAWQKQLNRWLRLKHLKPVAADGAFGPGTQAATQALQRAASLTPDGVVGPATRKALAKALLVFKG